MIALSLSKAYQLLILTKTAIIRSSLTFKIKVYVYEKISPIIYCTIFNPKFYEY